jgi:dienelactone hydrolase
MTARRLPALPTLLAATALFAAGSESPLDPTGWGVVYDVPSTRDVVVRAGVPFLTDAGGTLTLDLSLPPAAGGTPPAVVFLNAIGDRPDDKLKDWAIYRSWPRLVAAHGLAGVSMETREGQVQECLRAVFRFLADHGAEHGIDGSRVGIYAASANVSGATEYLLGDDAAPEIRAAVLYYGAPPAGELRRDLPVLFVSPESDALGMVPELQALWSRVLERSAPWTIVLASDMPHGFDAFSDTDEARRLVRQTIAFWKAHLDPLPPPGPPSEAREIVAAMYGNDAQRAVELLEGWLAVHPEDAVGHVSYGRMLAQLGRIPEATASFERALALGSTDPGMYIGLGLARAGQQRWREAAEFLERALAAGVTAGHVYGQLALAQLYLGRNEEAVRNYERALEAGIPSGNVRSVSLYNLACGYARLGQNERALDALSRAVDEGFVDRATLAADPDLQPVRELPRFHEIMARLPATAGG